MISSNIQPNFFNWPQIAVEHSGLCADIRAVSFVYLVLFLSFARLSLEQKLQRKLQKLQV